MSNCEFQTLGVSCMFIRSSAGVFGYSIARIQRVTLAASPSNSMVCTLYESDMYCRYVSRPSHALARQMHHGGSRHLQISNIPTLARSYFAKISYGPQSTPHILRLRVPRFSSAPPCSSYPALQVSRPAAINVTANSAW